MNLRPCRGCKRPVLDLFGQCTFLPPEAVRALPDGSAASGLMGTWHVSCLLREPQRRDWQHALVTFHVAAHGYRVVAACKHGVIMRGAFVGRAAVTPDAVVLDLVTTKGSVRHAPGGKIYGSFVDALSLELENTELIAHLQARLQTDGRIPLLDIYALLGIRDTVIHPESLVGARVVYNDFFEHFWTDNLIIVPCHHGVFIPNGLAAFITARRRA